MTEDDAKAAEGTAPAPTDQAPTDEASAATAADAPTATPWWKNANTWWITGAVGAAGAAVYGVLTLSSWISHWQDAAAELEAEAIDKGEKIVAAEYEFAELTTLTGLMAEQAEVAAEQAADAVEEAGEETAATAELRATLSNLMQCSIDMQNVSDKYYGGSSSSKERERNAIREACDEAWKRFKAASRG